MLEIKNLCAEVNDKKILNDISFKIKNGSLHVFLGPNGSGKTTLAKTIMGLNQNNLKKGNIVFNSKSITKLKPEARAKLGIALVFQHPPAIKGVKLFDFLNTIAKEKNYKKYIKEELLQRQINANFSGGVIYT